MNMFARFDENPAMTLRVIKETKRYGRTHARTDGRTDGQRENSIPPTNKVCGGYKKKIFQEYIQSASLEPDQARHFVWPDLSPNCLQRLSSDNTGRQRF